jgi:cell division transport system permease protein
MISFLRVIKTGFINFWRNIWLSSAATLVMTTTLVILSILLLIFIVTSYSINSVRERVDMSVYFKTGLAENQIFAIKDEVQDNPLVTEVTYVSAEQGLEEFKKKNLDNPLISDSLVELNENPIPATLRIKAKTLDDYPTIAESLQAEKYKSAVESLNFDDNRVIIERLNKILDFVQSSGIILVVIFSFIAVLVIFNTITLTIYNRREEIEIMRLVGATNWYIRGPFLVEAVMYSMMATLITFGLLVIVYKNALPKLQNYFIGASDFSLVLLNIPLLKNGSIVNLPALLLGLIAISVSLSVVSTLLSMRKYLKI